MKKFKKLLFILLIGSLLVLVACRQADTPAKTNDNDPNQSQNNQGGSEDNNGQEQPKETPRFKEDYTPTLFSDVTYTITQITDGVDLYTYTLTKTNGDKCVIWEVEVDLSKATIKAGTKNNVSIGFDYSKVTPYNAGASFTSATGKAVYATLNADFFGSECVNAFVKDGFIVKAGHNDNGSYDYASDASDVPASAPMLFGIKGEAAKVGPIIAYEGDITTVPVKKQLIRAKLTYQIQAGIKSCDTSDSFKLINSTVYLNPDDMYVIVDLAGGANNVLVEEVGIASAKMTLPRLEGSKAYLYCSSANSEAIAFVNTIAEGATLSFSVKSPDGAWDGFDTILGCRQALVIDGKVASTISLEASNGAKNGDVPRSSVGVNVDGKVCIYAVESLYYGKKASDDDPHGCNLEMLAEFMLYNNVINGANFDGGGSTQLICKIDGTDQVLVRSSDTGSSSLTSTRSVMNVIMVTEK